MRENEQSIRNWWRGWKTYYEPKEVGCSGFAGRSLYKVHDYLSITKAAKKRAIQSMSEATRWLWIKSADAWAVAAGMQVGARSTPAALPGRGYLMLRDPKHPRIPGHIADDASQHIQKIPKCFLILKPMEFHVTVRTSSLPHAGTYNMVWLSLVGTQSQSHPVRVDSATQHIISGSAWTIVMRTNEDLGSVVLIRLRLEPRHGFPDLDWHCQDVQLQKSSAGQEVICFPCNRWLRTVDGDIELCSEQVCPLNLETVQILRDYRTKELQNKQQQIRWRTFIDGAPRCVDVDGLQQLGPNLCYTRQSPGIDLFYLKGFADRGTSWNNLQELEILLAHQGRDNSVAKYVQAHWREDAFFGYQCLNGCNPLVIRQIHNMPSNFSVTPDMLRAFLPEGSSLEAELESGRIYLLDYEVLEDLPANVINERQHYLTAPLCLLYYNQQGELKPIAIQLKQTAGENNPVFLPSDPEPDWLLAKIFVRNADFQCHQLLSHYLRTHALGEVYCVATLRQLPEVHPIHKLLMPHIRTTLQINIQARASLLAANGVFDKSIASGLKTLPGLLAGGTARLSYNSLCVPDDLRERGLDNLPNCYYAQDSLRVWNTLHRFVSGWVSLYYSGDEEVQQDCELQNWIREIFTEGLLGRAESGMPASFQTMEELNKFVTMVMFCCSALHAAVNFSQLDFNMWMPNCPAAMPRPPPKSKGSVKEEELLSFLPDVNATCRVLMVLSQLSQPAADFVPLCQYREPYFSTSTHRKLLEEVQRELHVIANEISLRNSNLELPYPYLSPDRIENSVAI
ncbi:arachidonate 15-lipoxygenase B [Chanos chanos]|uniref:Arachidonate 15-lipoxygenase B n=1 Tax=Chanos chanos TaxID=29144 RepID=A0A6J2W428_CHACN|nr:arachidonate 15-lipoxygenase B-like [Chanos chanos]